MLNDYSDRPNGREPTTPRWQNVLMWCAVGAVMGLLALGIVDGIRTGMWNW